MSIDYEKLWKETELARLSEPLAEAKIFGSVTFTGSSSDAGIFEQNGNVVKSASGERLYRCTECGRIDLKHSFWTYGGPNRLNGGECYAHLRKSKNARAKA